VALVVLLGLLERLTATVLADSPLGNLAVFQWLRVHRPDLASSASFAGTVVQVAAVFLGLYYTAVSVVVSNSYKDVPGGVRRQILKEQAGTYYVDTVAFAGAMALVMNAAVVLGWNPGWINFVVLVLLSVASIFAFVVLGIRLFEFFDPASIAGVLTHDIYRKARASTPRGYRWDDAAFQDSYRRQATNDLKVLRHVVSLAGTRESRAGESLKTVAQHILQLFTSYATIIPEIPVESRWFQRVPQHPSWLIADDTRLRLAVQTQTGLDAELVPDHFWLESQLLTGLRDALQALLARREHEAVAQVSAQAKDVVEYLAARFQIDHAMGLHQVLSTLGRDEMRSATAVVLEPRDDYYRIGAIELLLMGSIQLILGLAKAVQTLSPEWLRSFASSAAVRPPGAPIGHPVPRTVREELGRLRSAMEFERAAEGQQVTPVWFLAHHLGRSYASFLAETLPVLVEEAESTYVNTVRDLWKVAPTAIVVTATQRGLEACDKLEVHLERIASVHQRLLSVQRAVDTNDAWPVLDIQPLMLRVTSLRDDLLTLLAKVSPRLSDEVPTGELPDDFGQIYTALTEGSFDALVAGRWALLERILPAAILLAFRAHDRLRHEGAHLSPEYQIGVQSDVVADPLELSGYALLLSDLQGGPAWDTTVKIWDQIINAHEDPAGLIKLIIAHWKFARSSFLWMSPPRKLRRMAWQQTIQSRLQALGLLDGRPSWSPAYQHQQEEVTPLVAAYLHTRNLRSSAGDLFLAHYLFARPEAEGIEVPDSVAAVQDEIDRARATRKTRRAGDAE
jgi:hypothetical protein